MTSQTLIQVSVQVEIINAYYLFGKLLQTKSPYIKPRLRTDIITDEAPKVSDQAASRLHQSSHFDF